MAVYISADWLFISSSLKVASRMLFIIICTKIPSICFAAAFSAPGDCRPASRFR